MPKKSEYVKFKNFVRNIKSTFMIYEDSKVFEDHRKQNVPEDNRKRKPIESYNNKYQKHIACSYSYKLVCADDKFSRPFKSYLGEYTVYNFISSMTE